MHRPYRTDYPLIAVERLSDGQTVLELDWPSSRGPASFCPDGKTLATSASTGIPVYSIVLPP